MAGEVWQSMRPVASWSAERGSGRVCRGGAVGGGSGCEARSEASGEGQITNRTATAASANSTQRVREPAVAGLFYPGEGAKLAKAIDELLAKAPVREIRG